MVATSVQTVMPESETLLPLSAANAEEHTIQTAVAAAGTSKTQIGRMVGVLAGVLAVVALGAAPTLLATGTHLRRVATEPPMLHEIVDASVQKYSAWAYGTLPGHDCSQIRYCAEPGHRCYKKDDHWAGCRASCTPGRIWEDDHRDHRTPWSCELIQDPNNGHRGMRPAASRHENCWQRAGRCAEQGHRCYKKDKHWAGCRASCTPGIYEDDEPPYKTHWSCEDVGREDVGRPYFPDEKHIAVKVRGGLCLAQPRRGEPVRFAQCAGYMTWRTSRESFGNFDLWFLSGGKGDYAAAAIRPAHCPQFVASGSAANAEELGTCKNGWGLQRNGRKTDFKIELTKDGRAYGLCLTSAEERAGDHAIWMPCARFGLRFREY